MLVSHTHRFIYFKTVKTAGTSVEMALQRYCLPPDMAEDTVQALKEAAMETETGIVGKRGPSRPGVDHWFNHMPAQRIRRQLDDPAIWNGYLKFCNIRNPWDKVVSWFHFRHPQAKTLSHAETVASFRAWLPGTDEVGRDFHIYSIDGKPVADDYIRYDRLEEDFTRICGKLDLDPGILPRFKTAERGDAKIPYQDYYDDASRARVAQDFAPDIAAFGWTFENG
ncbi:sulfotransferase family protein [Chachezhania sediminis]|uniref:sulfotransferase family 2 domain-containing protein n=1 Tax=Chachezhania sediminis TaxID=2599291 RepID=UPI00131B7065|nr:sulfotransferase family 2 domain-containing protein [Chachezhania sediminis]